MRLYLAILFKIRKKRSFLLVVTISLTPGHQPRSSGYEIVADN